MTEDAATLIQRAEHLLQRLDHSGQEWFSREIADCVRSLLALLTARETALQQAERNYLRAWEARDDVISKAKRTDATEAKVTALETALASAQQRIVELEKR